MLSAQDTLAAVQQKGKTAPVDVALRAGHGIFVPEQGVDMVLFLVSCML